MTPSPWALPPLGLYIHLPWCLKKCPYCDFNSHATATQKVDSYHIPEQAYVDALLRSIETNAALVKGRALHSIFFGGGTPSLFSAHSIGRILDAVTCQFSCVSNIEITLEANPSSFEIKRFADYKLAGINRLSIGVQSFNADSLQALGRLHDGAQAKKAIESAQHLGFTRINIDLMHGLPNQTTAMACSDIKQALALGSQHISWYQLTLEPNTLFYNYPPTLPDDNTLGAIQTEGSELLQAAGFNQYEVSAWCQGTLDDGHGAQHNLNYWQFGDYLGIGAGAHGKISLWDETGDMPKLNITRTTQARHPDAYMQAIDPTSSHTLVKPADLPLEFFMNALRLQEGVDETLYAQRTGLSLDTLKPLHTLRQKQLIQPHRLATTNLGWRFLDDVLLAFKS